MKFTSGLPALLLVAIASCNKDDKADNIETPRIFTANGENISSTMSQLRQEHGELNTTPVQSAKDVN